MSISTDPGRTFDINSLKISEFDKVSLSTIYLKQNTKWQTAKRISFKVKDAQYQHLLNIVLEVLLAQ